MRIKNFLLVIIIVICLGAGFGSGLLYANKKAATPIDYKLLNTKSEVQIDFALFWDVWRLLQKKYIKQPIDQQKLFYGAVKGMVEALDDPYSSFMDPTETREFQQELDGKFEGIGAEIGMKKERLVIIAPIDGSPASKAGLRAGDWIVEIDDKSTVDLSLTEAVQKIRGNSGTKVELSIVRDENQTEPTKFEITREKIEVPSIKTKALGEDIYRITISSFGNDSAHEFDKAVREISGKNPRGIILDLRNNPGGLLTASVNMLGEFIPTGTTVVTEEFGDKEKREFRTEGKSNFEDLPLVILVNEGSASASEIMAGALKQLKKVKLVGETTYGKGTVQDFEDLAQETSIRITVAKWLLPDGKQIPEEGIEPDFKVEFTPEDYDQDKDPQLDKAIEVINAEIK